LDQLQVVSTTDGKVGSSYNPKADIFEGWLTPDGRQIVAVMFGKVRVWDLRTRKPAFTLDTTYSRILAAALSADGRRLAVTSEPVYGPDGTDEKPALQIADAFDQRRQPVVY
jgi:WD40 repeat protein